MQELAKLAILDSNAYEEALHESEDYHDVYALPEERRRKKMYKPPTQHHYHDQVIVESDHSVWQVTAAESHSTAQALELPAAISKEEDSTDVAGKNRADVEAAQEERQTKVKFTIPDDVGNGKGTGKPSRRIMNANIDEAEEDLSPEELARKKHRLIMERQDVFSAAELLAIRVEFNKVDEDGSGSIDAKELATIIRNLGGEISDEKVEKILRDIDEDGSGEVDWVEYLSLMNKIKSGDSGEVIQGFLQNALMILFVEPDIFHRRYLAKILRQAIKDEMGSEHAVDIIEVGSAQSALQKIEHCPSGRRFAFVLSRCQMPVMTGIGLCQALKEDVFAAPSVILYDSKRMDIPRGLCAEEIQLEYFNRIRARKLIIEHCQQTQFNTKSRMPHAKHVKPKTAKEMQDDLAKSGRRTFREGYKPKPPPKRSAFSKHRFESHAFSPRALQGLKEAAGAETPRRIEVVKKAQKESPKAMMKLRMATLLGGIIT